MKRIFTAVLLSFVSVALFAQAHRAPAPSAAHSRAAQGRSASRSTVSREGHRVPNGDHRGGGHDRDRGGRFGRFGGRFAYFYSSAYPLYPFWGWGFGWDGYGWYSPVYSYAGREADAGTVEFNITPEDAAVYLDDAFLGAASGIESGVPMKPGRHKLSVVRPGLQTKTVEIDVVAGQKQTVVVAL
jgi:hypothetical protein